MTKYSSKLGGGSENTNIGIDSNEATGSFAKTNTFTRSHWYLMVVTYDAVTKDLKLYMNRTVNNVEQMTLIGTVANKTLDISPSTDLVLYLGFLKGKRQFRNEYVHGIKIWQDALTLENIQWLYKHPEY